MLSYPYMYHVFILMLTIYKSFTSVSLIIKKVNGGVADFQFTFDCVYKFIDFWS